ncbi:unnamed protein product [Nippostrongylus brasiliensis]|uniref:Ig-like domain-containing protein n=1 Tax=Nippostrongylus brasiliensis TaxID=27835 RepID=A0A0N4Y800_NIPBR|nr:unnamed protein product [Nippostrongylus brasiliensis]
MCEVVFAGVGKSMAVWYRNGEQIGTVTSDSNVIFENRNYTAEQPVPEVGFLIMSNITKDDEGLYWCRHAETGVVGDVFSLKVAYVDAIPADKYIEVLVGKSGNCEKSGVMYEIECRACKGKYIGETGRVLLARINEHLAVHIGNDFAVMWKILSYETGISSRKALKMFWICARDPVMNYRKESLSIRNDPRWVPRFPTLGEQVALMCPIPKAVPQPTINWLLNGEPVAHTSTDAHAFPNGTLIIRHFTPAHNGVYECVVWNFASRTSSQVTIDSKKAAARNAFASNSSNTRCSLLFRSSVLWFLVGCLVTSCSVLIYLLCALVLIRPTPRATMVPSMWARSNPLLGPGFRKVVVPVPDFITGRLSNSAPSRPFEDV